jgi:hypothetical protein
MPPRERAASGEKVLAPLVHVVVRRSMLRPAWPRAEERLSLQIGPPPPQQRYLISPLALPASGNDRLRGRTLTLPLNPSGTARCHRDQGQHAP